MAESHDKTPIRGHRFIDLSADEIRAKRKLDPKYVECPKCKGADKGCDQCCFYGTVLRNTKDASCIHAWKVTEKLGRCLHKSVCIICGETKEVDSSD